MNDILYYLASLIAILFVFVPHEFAHAYVAHKCGDDTAKMRGRMTLNPLKHFDPIGFIMCAAVGFGWARPVPIDPYNFRNYRKGLFLTSIAGVATNYIIAFFGYLLYVVIYLYFPHSTTALHNLWYFFVYLTLDLFVFDLCVFIFNLLPLYPLDGFRIVESVARTYSPVKRFLRKYGQYILIGLVIESFICGRLQGYVPYIEYFNVLGYVQWFAVNILGYPIRLVWNLVFNQGIPGLMPYGKSLYYIVRY